MVMDIERVRSFVRLAERLHFGQTAGLLNLSQPALSKQIRLLESELGISLFNRDRHGVSLTDSGELFLPEAQKLVKHFDEVYEKGKRIGRGELGTISIGFGLSTLTMVPQVISRFRVRYPEVEVKLQELSTSKQLAGLESGQLNIGFVRLPVSEKFAFKMVVRDELVLVLPEKDENLNSKAGLEEFKNEGFIVNYRQRSETLNDHVLEVCRSYGFYPKIVQQAFEFPTVLALVAAGLGIALVPKSQLRVKVEGVTFRKLDSSVAAWKIGAVWQKDNLQPLTKVFLDILSEEI